MKPGRELNEIIVRDVMKWKQHPDFKHIWYSQEHFASPGEALPDFSSSLYQAERVLKKIGAIAKEFISNGDGTGRVILELSEGRRVVGTGRSHAHAICMAALKAEGFEE